MDLLEYQENIKLRDEKLREREECVANIEDSQNSKAIYERQLEAIDNKIQEIESLMDFKENYEEVTKYIKNNSLKKLLVRIGLVLLGCAVGTVLFSPIIYTLAFFIAAGAVATGVTFDEYKKQMDEKIKMLATTDTHDLQEEIYDLEKEYDESKEDYDFIVSEIKMYQSHLKEIDNILSKFGDVIQGSNYSDAIIPSTRTRKKY